MMEVEEEDSPFSGSFMDLTSVLLEAAKDMSQDSVLTMKNFTLHDAMMAIQVMDPRMDSGMERDGHPRRSFNPYQLFLPEEICWMMDRMFSAEILWHTGHSLSQSVFTCLYTHEIGIGRLWNGSKVSTAILKFPQDPRRPIQLITLVLRAAVHALLKTCDLAWREMTKGYINEMEDFNADKSERFICETISEAEILGMLDAARSWLLSKQAASIAYRAELIARIDLRRAMLVILSSTLPSEEKHFQATIRQACSHLRDIKSLSTPRTPPEGSPAWQTFDPAILRRLISVMPSKIVLLPDQTETWDQYTLLLDGLKEVGLLSRCFAFTTIKDLLEWRAIQPPRMNRGPLLRSLACTAIRNARGDWWASELFPVFANADLESTFGRSLPMSRLHQSPPGYFQVYLGKMVREYIASFFCNRPRQRRQLCNWMGEWKVLGPQLTIFAASLEPINPKGYPSAPLSTAVTKAVVDVNRIISGYTLVRLMAATHIVLAGLELDIHGKEELPFVLWYGANMYRALAETMRKIVEADHGPSSFPVEKKIEDYLLSQISWANVMAHYCITASMTYLLVSNSITLSRREQVNLRRRFKWAFETTESSNGARNTHPHPSSQRHKQQSMPPPHPPSAEKQEPDSDFNDPCLPEFAEWELFLRRVVERDAASQIEKLVSMYKSLVKHLKTYGEETLQKDNSSAIVSAPQNGIIDEKPALPPRPRTMGDVLRDIFIAGPADPHSTTGKEAADQKVEKTIVDLQMEVINEMKATASLNLKTLMRFEPSTSASPVASPRTSAEIDVVEQETGTRIRSSSDNSRNYPILVDENVIPNDIAAVTGSNEEATVDIIRNDEGPVHMSSKEGSNRKPDGEGKGGDGRVDEGREECVSGISVASGNDYTSLALDGGRYSILSSGSGNRNIRATGGDGGVEASRGRSDSGCRPTSGTAAVQIDSQDAETASSLRMEDLSTLVRVETDAGIEMQGVVVEAARHAEKGGEEAWKKVLAGLRVDMEGSPSRWFPIVRGGL